VQNVSKPQTPIGNGNLITNKLAKAD